jgi:hypothetical protein
MTGGMTVAQNRSHPSISQNSLVESNAIRFLNKVIVQPVGKKLLEEKDYQGLKLSSV